MSDKRCGILRDHDPHSWGGLNWCPGGTPTPVPSEVAETTAGEREDYGPTEYIEEEHDCDGSDEHPLPCWPACTTRTPAEPDAREAEALAKVIGAEVWRIHGPESTDEDSAAMDGEDIARAVLASPALAALLDRVRREEGEKVLREAADALGHRWQSDPIPSASIVYAALRDRAASVGRGEGP